MSPVMLTLNCGGCDASTTVGPLRRRFHGTHGDHGWGVWKTDAPQSLTPNGWVMFDPYTQATYCPTCWAAIDAGLPRDGADDEGCGLGCNPMTCGCGDGAGTYKRCESCGGSGVLLPLGPAFGENPPCESCDGKGRHFA